MAKKRFYVTTAIDYVNAAPHVGHAFEKVLADALVRWHKVKGEETWFLTGTDENAQKNVQVAKEKGIPVRDFVDKNSGIFVRLCKELNINYDRFIRTTDKDHVKKCQEIFKLIYDKGDIYKGKYEGLYCVGCESFKTERELVDGKCPEHNRVPELISEDAYFFKLSKYKDKILKFVEDYIVPESKKKEIIARLKEEGLKDLSVTRKNLDWGIPCPIDKEHKIYVWLDALINYITGAGKNEEYWPADVHVIGKGINWFHSVIWPGILFSAGYKTPKRLLVHGYLNLKGQKISKSLGNTIDPLVLVSKCGADSVRYSLLKNSVFDDSDYGEEILIERHNSELADKLGNLISRVSALAERYGIKKCDNKLIKKLKLKEIEKHFENYEIDKALNLIFSFIDECNLFVQENKIWEDSCKNKEEKLYQLADSIKAVSILLWPFVPETSEKISKTFGFKVGFASFGEIKKPLKVSKIKKADILFKKIEVKEENKITSKTIKDNKINKWENTEKSKKIEGVMTMGEISFDEWSKLDLRVGKITKVDDIEGADKLYKLSLDCGREIGKRIVCAGIKQFYSSKELKGKKVILFVNLKPRMMKGIESQGMLLAAGNKEKNTCVLISPEKDIEVGSKVS